MPQRSRTYFIKFPLPRLARLQGLWPLPCNSLIGLWQDGVIAIDCRSGKQDRPDDEQLDILGENRKNVQKADSAIRLRCQSRVVVLHFFLEGINHRVT